MPIGQRSAVLLSAVMGLTLAIALSAGVTSLDDDFKVQRAGQPSEAFKEKWEGVDVHTIDWKAKMDFCGSNKTCAKVAGEMAMEKERQLLDAGALPACSEKNQNLMEEIGVLKREIKAGEDKLAKFREAIKKTEDSGNVKAAAKEPAASAQAVATGTKQGKQAAVMLGESKDKATAISAETTTLVPNRTLVLQAIANKTNVANATYASIFACRRKTLELMLELKASKVARVSIDTKQMQVAEDVQISTGGGGSLPKTGSTPKQ